MRKSIITILVVAVGIVSMCSILSKTARTSVSSNKNISTKRNNVLDPILVGRAIDGQVIILRVDPRAGTIIVVVVIETSIRILPVLLRPVDIITRVVVMGTILIARRRRRRRKINVV
jgi:uncharacterized membrane protein